MGKKVIERKVTPLYYRTTDIWEKIKVLEGDYHIMDFKFNKINQRTKYLFVKRKFKYNIEIKKI